MKQNTKKIQCGRSMVEIIGVLSIMGMLSIGAMMGYNQLNSSYTANQIVDSISKVQALIYARQVRSVHDVESFLKKANLRYMAKTNPVIVSASGSSRSSTHLFEIKLENVPENIADNLMSNTGFKFCTDDSGNVPESKTGVSAVKSKMLNLCKTGACSDKEMLKANEYKKCVLVERSISTKDKSQSLSFTIRQTGKRF